MPLHTLISKYMLKMTESGEFNNYGIHSVSAKSSHATFGKLSFTAAVIKIIVSHQSYRPMAE